MSEGSDSPTTVNVTALKTRVDKIHFEGLGRTKRDVLSHLVSPLLRSDNFGEVLLNLELVKQKFTELGLFRDVTISLDESSSPATSGRTNVSVTFEVEESKRYAGGIFTSASNNGVSGILELKSPNLFGRG